jgi:Tol biopolymer transport system component/predicted Ser/Thr protein kinase
MPLAAGQKIGPYEVLAKLGEGGMGEVYRAKDSKLKREVALKVLPAEVANDRERLARFQREAEVLASLNHPHIAQVYGIEDHALVMELVEGEDLAQRIARGPIPIDDALPIAKQIAEALEAAHEQGIIHRDLKPANVKVRPDGTVKVLDFGLAKALDPRSGLGAPGSGEIANSPTITTPAMTMHGMILGTAAYMAPEQAKGRVVDKRADIWAFGCVLYEMLSGRRAFMGEDATDTIAEVLKSTINYNALPPAIPGGARRLIDRCLQRDPKRRLRDIGDARAEIEFLLAGPDATAEAPAPSRSPWLPIAGSAVVAAALVGGIAWVWRPVTPPPAVVRFQIAATADAALQTNFNRQVIAVSPDGTRFVYSGDRLYMRSISDAGLQPIPGTENLMSTTHPAFSPDGRSLVFWAASDRTLKRLTLGSTAVSTLCQLSEGGLAVQWFGDQIYFADTAYGIKRVSANGGQPELIIQVSGREELYGPQVLPGGDAIMFTVGRRAMTSWDQASIVIQSLRTKARKTVLENATDARYVSTGHLLFGRGGVLYAAPFDLRQQAVVGEPIAVVEGVRRAAPGTTGAVHVAVSDSGTLVYLSGPVSASGGALHLALFDRAGTAEPLSVPLGAYSHPRISPDGARVAVGVDDGRERQVWIYGLSKSSAARRLTFGGENQYAEWSPDGQRVAFQSTREGEAGIWWQRADGTDTAARLTRPAKGVTHVPQSFSRDGRHLIYDEIKSDRVSMWDLTIANGKATPMPLNDSIATTDATVSPDGHWLAYTSQSPDASTSVVFVEPYPPTGARYQISKQTDDGHHPAWSRDGKELFFTPGPGNRFYGVPITTTPTFAFGDAVTINRPFVNAPPSAERTYDVSGDKRFLGLRTDIGPDGRPMSPQMHVVLNWFEELKQRVPTR